MTTTKIALSPALQDVHPRFQTAFNNRNPDGILALFEPDAVYINIDGAVLHGHDEIRVAFRRIFSGELQVRLETAGVLEHPAGLALMHAKWVMRGIGPDGEKVERNGTGAEVLRRQGNGSWLYALNNPFVPFAI